jgi:membrane associated rhomboid family serine protease
MFIHGGPIHLLGNMWFLVIFGDNVEDRLGHAAYFWFYLLCGIGAEISHVLANPLSNVPSIGASGCISGILAAYLVFFPNARVLIFNPLMDLGSLFEIYAIASRKVLIKIPALLFLGVWFAFQWLTASWTLYTGTYHNESVAWFAHIGGFVIGLTTLALPRGPELPDDPEEAMKDPYEQLDIPESWHVTRKQLEEVVAPLPDNPPLPGWFWALMGVVFVFEVIALIVEIVKYQ